MLTVPMTSITGYVTYLRFASGVQKGQTAQNTVFNTPYSLGKMDEGRIEYTAAYVVESFDTITSGTTKVAWRPVVADSATPLDANGDPLTVAGFAVAADGTITATGSLASVKKVRYAYNNAFIPAYSNFDADASTMPNLPERTIPTLKAEMVGITLEAKVRRIAIYYSQLAAFQAKTDYGTDLGEQLATQAQGELNYEVDSEGVNMLHKAADVDTSLNFPTYEAAMATVGNSLYISRSQYYEGFAEIINRAKKVIYDRTNKFSPNYMVVSSDVLTILPYLRGWTAAPAAQVNGPYFAGSVDSIKVFVSPQLSAGEYFFGVNGTDLQTSAAIFAPYMA